MQSLKSRGYVKEQFAWRTYYWYLTNEGIQFLRDYLHLPAEIVPSTLKRQARADPRPRYERVSLIEFHQVWAGKVLSHFPTKVAGGCVDTGVDRG